MTAHFVLHGFRRRALLHAVLGVIAAIAITGCATGVGSPSNLSANRALHFGTCQCDSANSGVPVGWSSQLYFFVGKAHSVTITSVSARAVGRGVITGVAVVNNGLGNLSTDAEGSGGTTTIPPSWVRGLDRGKATLPLQLQPGAVYTVLIEVHNSRNLKVAGYTGVKIDLKVDGLHLTRTADVGVFYCMGSFQHSVTSCEHAIGRAQSTNAGDWYVWPSRLPIITYR